MIRRGIAAASLAVALSACRYHGAIYSSYQQLGLDIRASTESNAPVKVSLSYERGVGALVPKRDVDKSEGEAVSLISQDDVFTIAAPPDKQGWFSKSLLKTSSAFVSGTAAVVAAAPADVEVKIDDAPGVGKLALKTHGGPGARIATAFSPTARFQTSAQAELQRLIDLVDEKPVAEQKEVFDRVATIIGDGFEDRYRRNAARVSPKDAFLSAKNHYVTEGPRDEQKNERLVEALESALR